MALSRAHVEVLPDGADVKSSVLLSNTKSRRAKPSADKLQAMAALDLRGHLTSPAPLGGSQLCSRHEPSAPC